MKRKRILSPRVRKYRFALFLLLMLLFSSLPSVHPRIYCENPPVNSTVGSTTSFPGSCTVFTASHGQHVLFASNEDFHNPDTYIWTVPSSEHNLGGLYYGYEYGRPQGGVNLAGLAFDALALPEAELNNHPELPYRGRSGTAFLKKLMAESTTVDEGINFVLAYNWGKSVSFQVFLADASGDAVIISAGKDGELAFTRKAAGDGYLAATNFNPANPENRFDPPPCWRHDTAEKMLTQIDNDGNLSPEVFAKILDAVHVEGDEHNTLYSNIIDLEAREVHLYYWHQFDEAVILNINEQVRSGIPITSLSALFSDHTVKQAKDEHQQHINRVVRDAWLNQYVKVLVIGVSVGILILVLTVILVKRRKRMSENSLKTKKFEFSYKTLGLPVGLLLGGLAGLLTRNPALSAGGGMVIGLAIGSALDAKKAQVSSSDELTED